MLGLKSPIRKKHYASCKNFFSHLKSESLKLSPPQTKEKLIRQVKDYIDWYNYDKPQET
ncbi:IS3 family transposase [Streptococcus sp. DD04]|uniref:IS3 family transposase n=1 Tax=Streptococcus sp. DD04 TaxID=1776578 RepID=UPI0009EC6084